MLPHVDHELWHALYTLVVRYWYDVDFNDGRNAHLFYLPDGIFSVGDNEFRFNPQLLCYAARGEHGPEIWIDSSHLISLSCGSDCPPSPVAADIEQPFPESARQANLRDRIGVQAANEFLV